MEKNATSQMSRERHRVITQFSLCQDPSKISDLPQEQTFSAKHGSGFRNRTRQPEDAGEDIVRDDYREKYDMCSIRVG